MAELRREQPFRDREAPNGAARNPTNAGEEQAEEVAEDFRHFRCGLREEAVDSSTKEIDRLAKS